MVDRDYSMMITHSNEWLKQTTYSCLCQYKKKNRIKCSVENVKTGKVKIFNSFNDADIFYSWLNKRSSQASRKNNLVEGTYRVKAIKNET
jgi:hypothetical protein